MSHGGRAMSVVHFTFATECENIDFLYHNDCRGHCVMESIIELAMYHYPLSIGYLNTRPKFRRDYL